MNSKTFFVFALTALCLTAALIGGFVASRPVQTDDGHKLGSLDINVLPTTPTATKVWVGTGLTGDTVVIATSTGRVRLEIGNISGATSTPQALYCNVGDRPSVLYEGMVVQASSSVVFVLDHLMRGAVRCRYPVASSSVTVIDY